MQRLLPEWGPQRGVLLAWPHRKSDWLERLHSIIPVYQRITDYISRYQDIHILCLDRSVETEVRAWAAVHASDPSRVHTHQIETNDTWIRDYGPLSVIHADGRVSWLDFTFNGWGNKYDAALDNTASAHLVKLGLAPDAGLKHVHMVLEGGSIDINDDGVVLTTSNCLLNSNRNPDLSKSEIETQLREHLGATDIIWLNNGYLEGDDTDSHIDTLARFCDNNTIIYCACNDPSDIHYEPLINMATELKQWNRRHGEPFRLQACPLPAPLFGPDHARLPATYVNFLIINQAVLVPTYNDPVGDQEALACIRSCFPHRDILTVDCQALVEQNGSLHCATMQFT